MRTPPKKKRESGALKEVWQAHNEMIDFVRETAPMPSSGSGVIVTRTSNGTQFKVDRRTIEEVQSGVIEKVAIAEVFGDYLRCTKSDGEAVIVAKPYYLRRTTLLQTYSAVDATGNSRTTRSGNALLVEPLEPIYSSAGFILISIPEGGTQLSVGGTSVEWCDLNIDARHFDAPYVTVAVCINNDSNWRMYVRGSAPFRP